MRRSRLKDTFKDHFLVGTAVNRSMVTGGTGFRRSAEQNAADVALLKEQFNQITAENDMKWQLIHPREGADGYDFGPADAFVNFGLSNNMYLVGHTLVWHSQTPNWVFAGTNPPPASATNAAPAVAANTNAPGDEPIRARTIWSRIRRRFRPLHRPARVARRIASADARAHSHRRRPLQGQDQSLGRRERSHRRR